MRTNTFKVVEACFLEIAEPSIPQGIELCAKKGANEIVIMPYFLAAGRHVMEDIPSIVNNEKEKYPNINIRSLPYLGSSPVIVDILKTLAENDA
jgi:sirohydrochlorin ferrochelatase